MRPKRQCPFVYQRAYAEEAKAASRGPWAAGVYAQGTCPIERYIPDYDECCPPGTIAAYDNLNIPYCKQVVFEEGAVVSVSRQYGQVIPGVAYQVISRSHPVNTPPGTYVYSVGLDNSDTSADQVNPADLSPAPEFFLCNAHPPLPYDSRPYWLEPTGLPSQPGNWDLTSEILFDQTACYYGPVLTLRASIHVRQGAGVVSQWLLNQARQRFIDAARQKNQVPLLLRIYQDSSSGDYLLDFTIADLDPGTTPGPLPQRAVPHNAAGVIWALVALAIALIALLVTVRVTGVLQRSNGNPGRLIDAPPGSVSLPVIDPVTGQPILDAGGNRIPDLLSNGTPVPIGSVCTRNCKRVVPPSPGSPGLLSQATGIVKALAWGAAAIGVTIIAVQVLPKILGGGDGGRSRRNV